MGGGGKLRGEWKRCGGQAKRRVEEMGGGGLGKVRQGGRCGGGWQKGGIGQGKMRVEEVGGKDKGVCVGGEGGQNGGLVIVRDGEWERWG